MYYQSLAIHKINPFQEVNKRIKENHNSWAEVLDFLDRMKERSIYHVEVTIFDELGKVRTEKYKHDGFSWHMLQTFFV
jgi:hypothetical protein